MQGSAWRCTAWTSYSRLFIRPSRAVWEWACRSADQSLKIITGKSGQRPTRAPGQLSHSTCLASRLARMTEQRPTVFVVDDDVSVREAIKRMLESVGLRAKTFESTQEFLDRTA